MSDAVEKVVDLTDFPFGRRERTERSANLPVWSDVADHMHLAASDADLRSDTTSSFDWWSEQPESQRLKVLNDGREMELVARAGKPSQPQPFEAMMGFEMCEAHLDPLSLVA